MRTLYKIVAFVLTITWLFVAYKVIFDDDDRQEIVVSQQSQANPVPDIPPPCDIPPPPRLKPVSTVSKSSESSPLQWPPVLPDGSFPESDGHDIMPVTGLKVPKFWSPPINVDLNRVGSYVNGEETIFVMIASYRDFQCRETITSAFQRADHPERLFIGAVDQVVAGDIGCLDLEVPCDKDDSQPICRYRQQITLFTMDASKASGPVTARHVGDRLYRGQYYAMQLDAHCLFVRHWDTKLIGQFKATGNEMAVLTSYLTDVQGSITPSGDSTRKTRPIMCNSDFEGMMPARYLRHGAQPEVEPEVHGMPQLEPYWAAGFSFSRGHFIVRVPYDAYQPMVFQGEEINIGVRGFTHGYDFYAPEESVIFHEYAVHSSRRNKVHMFWENSGHAGDGMKSLRRTTGVIQLAPDLSPDDWDHSELDKYGLGTVRDVVLFYKLFLINTKDRRATQLCPFVRSGLMHKDFQKHLRSDGLGIDYSQLTDYDTAAVLTNFLVSQHPYWVKFCQGAIDQRKRGMLNECLTSAQRVHLDTADPALIQRVRDTLSHL